MERHKPGIIQNLDDLSETVSEVLSYRRSQDAINLSTKTHLSLLNRMYVFEFIRKTLKRCKNRLFK